MEREEASVSAANTRHAFSTGDSLMSKKPFNEETFDKELYMYDENSELSFQKHLIDLMNKKISITLRPINDPT